MMYSTIVIAAVVAYAAKFGISMFKHRKRPCEFCGHAFLWRFPEMRRPDYRPPIGNRFLCTMYRRCLNPFCTAFLRKEEGRSFVKEFNDLELFWRRLKFERFL